jgi:hypothetical protein
LQSCGQKFGLYWQLFIGVLSPTRGGYGVLHFLSSNQTQIWLRLKDIAKGVILGFGYDMGIGLPVGSTGVKTKALSGVGSGSRIDQVRVRLGGLRQNPYPESVRLAGLG